MGTYIEKLKQSNIIRSHESSNLFGLRVEYRGKTNEERLIIGSDCVINRIFVFATESGRITIGNRTFVGGSIFVRHSTCRHEDLIRNKMRVLHIH